MNLRQVTDLDELVTLTEGNPVVRHDLGRAWHAAYVDPATASRGALIVRRSPKPWLTALGEPAVLSALLAQAEVRRWVREIEPVSVWLPQGHPELVDGLLRLGDGGDWDWMWTETPPPVMPAEARLVRLEPADKEELDAFLAEHNPRTFGAPFERPDQVWVGIRDESGAMVACGCSEPGWTSAPMLAGITVDTARRGEGLGAAVTAWLTREGVERTGACTLGMYADNVVARALYHRLGYQTAGWWSSREVLEVLPE